MRQVLRSRAHCSSQAVRTATRIPSTWSRDCACHSHWVLPCCSAGCRAHPHLVHKQMPKRRGTVNEEMKRRGVCVFFGSSLLNTLEERLPCGLTNLMHPIAQTHNQRALHIFRTTVRSVSPEDVPTTWAFGSPSGRLRVNRRPTRADVKLAWLTLLSLGRTTTRLSHVSST